MVILEYNHISGGTSTMKLFFTILGILIAVFAISVAIACCSAAKQADEADERLFREYLRRKNVQEPPVA